MGSMCVPLYFVISGFLFFYNGQVLTKEWYLNKIKSRSFSLLMPYLLWCTIALIVFSINHSVSVIDMIKGYTIGVSFPNMNGGATSVWDGPLWFVRNLFVLMLISPAIHVFLHYKKFSAAVLGLMFVAWLGMVSPMEHGVFISLLFFSIGGWLGLRQQHITVKWKWRYPALYSMFVILWCISPIGYQDYILQFVKVSGMWLVLALACQFVAGKECVKDYGALSFFIFACHDILLPFVKGVVTFCYETLQIQGNASAYFCVVIMDFAFCVVIYKLINILMPKLSKPLTGSRG
ncbi:acyltransferase family protein [Bacteroides helcogenes]|uniref:Acyltransferase 3 domain-containing protein n=1 Tax=Bacteroides helcogenes (strain ATCC 35417 / DSM 20613 / JCM 6297 / CCUG 15421 / P 36-108) TaxID=693979 RepID=E6SQ91_BACT6|nr:acyltransferase [Bacteroides helcogenes]ADV43950.1 hypothetical protein Bache_1972 [Bacteroides helcogenes P 36-108]